MFDNMSYEEIMAIVNNMDDIRIRLFAEELTRWALVNRENAVKGMEEAKAEIATALNDNGGNGVQYAVDKFNYYKDNMKASNGFLNYSYYLKAQAEEDSEKENA